MLRLLRAAPQGLVRAGGQRTMVAASGSGGASTPAPPNIKELAKMAQLAVTEAEVRVRRDTLAGAQAASAACGSASPGRKTCLRNALHLWSFMPGLARGGDGVRPTARTPPEPEPFRLPAPRRRWPIGSRKSTAS
jgi:hypothetical protein